MKCMSAFIRRYHKPKTIAFLGQRSRRPFHDWITIDTQCCIFLTTKEGNDLILIDRSFRGRLDRRHSFKPGIASERAKHRLKIITFARTFLYNTISAMFLVSQSIGESACPVWTLPCPPRVQHARETQTQASSIP
jgi:hypothetical protein